jgi:hypothetical protein
VVEEE